MSKYSETTVIEQFVERFNNAITSGTADPYELLDEKVIVWILGTTPISGIYRGLEQVKRIFVATCARRLTEVNLELKEFIGSGRRVASLVVVTGKTPEGGVYNDDGDTCGCVFQVDNGRITEIRAFLDTTLIETLLFKNEYVPSGRLN